MTISPPWGSPARRHDTVAAPDVDPERFEAAFGDPEITYARIAAAIADFERHLAGRRSRSHDFGAGDSGAPIGCR